MELKKYKTIILVTLLLLALVAVILSYQRSQQSDELVSTPPTTADGTLVECYTDADCLISGCSGTLCIPRTESGNTVSTCEYRDEYACFADDNCLCRQNKCNWQGSELFTSCVRELVGDSCAGLVGDELAGCEIEQLNSTVCQGLTGLSYVDCIAGLTTDS